ncbi:unnamed protein product [Adineta steineri]|uniref:AIG1-type G domain-containing protein n=1 Tax=Adineta steineri TaxID=433720 RepID=A0A813MQ78_9BILA|nr:unnamed protein product [Adineta steineri]CAF3948182.1 unnamed protein product [Adineta steineri]
MATYANNNGNQYGLIILGNSGVGKSFLANILLDREVFKHEFSARSVTHRTEFQELTFDNHRYAIFNIPGLIEADQTRVDVNKREIDHAFNQRPNSLIIYVFGQQNGRIRDEDVVAFNAINKAYPLNIESLLIVVNGLPVDRPTNYEGEVMLMLQDIIQLPIKAERVCFLNMINRENSREKQTLRMQLLNAIVELSPTEHIKEQDIHLKVDEVKMLKKQIEQMTEAFENNKIHFQNEIREHQRRYDNLIANQKTETDSLRRIIERQVEEAQEMRESQEEQVRLMQNQIQKMETEQEQLQEKLRKKGNEETKAIQDALKASQQAQNELKQKIIELQNRPPHVITEKKKSSCFVAGTLIHMADGTDKPIEKIQVGDIVLGAGHQHHVVMFLDIERLEDRNLYGINDFPPFFTSEHVFFTADGTMLAIEPQASEDEEPSLRGLVHPLCINVELQALEQNRSSTIVVNHLNCVQDDPAMKVYNVVLESGHTYYANGFCVFDMFPNLAQYPRMFKFLHLLWRNCATQIDEHFDDVVTPGSEDRIRLEHFSKFIQQAIGTYLSKN